MEYLLYGFYAIFLTVTFGGAFYAVDIVEWFRARWSQCPRCRKIQKITKVNYITETLECAACGCHAVRQYKFVHIGKKVRVNSVRGRWRDRYAQKDKVIA